MCVFRPGSQKGSMSVEASIIIPVVFLSVIALVLLSILQFTATCTLAAADLASEAGADFFDSSRKDLCTGKISREDLGKDGLYRRLYDPDTARKLAAIEDFALKSFQGGLNGDSKIVTGAELSDWVLYKKITVSTRTEDTSKSNKNIPFFDIGTTGGYIAVSESVVNDPAEFIRNTDFLIDLEKELERKYPGLKNLGDKTRGTILDMKNKAEDLLK